MNTPLSTRTRLRNSQFSRALQYRPSRLRQWMDLARDVAVFILPGLVACAMWIAICMGLFWLILVSE